MAVPEGEASRHKRNQSICRVASTSQLGLPIMAFVPLLYSCYYMSLWLRQVPRVERPQVRAAA